MIVLFTIQFLGTSSQGQDQDIMFIPATSKFDNRTNQLEHLSSPAARNSVFLITFLGRQSLHMTRLPSDRSTAMTVVASPSDGTMMR